MIPDKRLNLSTGGLLNAADWVNEFANIIDLGTVRDIAKGRPLYCVVTITTAVNFTVNTDGVQFFVRLAPTSTIPVAGHWADFLVGCSSLYLENSLPKGEQVVFPLHNGVMPASRDAGAFLDSAIGQRYLYGHASIIDAATGILSANAAAGNTGAYDVDITTTPPSYGSVQAPAYPRGFTIKP